MISNSYRDLKRYLQVVASDVKITDNYFVVKNVTIIPHNRQSLFKDQIPVREDVLKGIDGNRIWYAVSHSDGVIYVQSLQKLKSFLQTEVTDGNYLIPISEFFDIKKIIPNPNANKVVHFHVHTAYSALDALALPEDIARRCKQLDIPAVAIADHGTLSGIIEFYQACKKYGVKPIIGQEFYLDDDRHSRGAPEAVRKAAKKDRGAVREWEKEHRLNLRRHLCLYAMNAEGLKNLYQLSSLAYLDGFYYRPRIDWEILNKYNAGLIATTACLGGVIVAETGQQRILNLKKLAKIFGRDRLYLEVMLLFYDEQPQANDDLFKLADQYKLQTILTLDAHFVDPDVDHIHNFYTKIGTNNVYGVGDNYLKTYSELEQSFKEKFSQCRYGWGYYDRARIGAIQAVDRCNVEIELGKFKLPKFNLATAVVPAQPDEDERKYMVRRAKEGFLKKITTKIKDRSVLQKYVDRLKHEISVFIEAGYVNYTLIVLDLVDYARSKNELALVRGSAAGSLLCYCLNLTTVDPIANDLLFERFVSPLRAGLVDKSYQSPPDIDCDFQDRDEIIEYASNKYGADCVARIGTCNRSQIKKAIKDMAEATDFMDFKAANIVTRMIPDSCKTLDQAIELSLTFGEWYNQPDNKKWVDKYVQPVLGLVGQHSIHASGVVIAPGKIQEFLPIKFQEKKKEKESDQDAVRFVVTQFEGESVEAIGLLKFDILRVRTLSHLNLTKRLIKARHGIDINYDEDIDLNDGRNYIGYQEKDTQGIFQLDTRATANLLNHLRINNFSDLTTAIALSRPGTAGPGLDMEYCARKAGKPFEYDHPLLKPILESTLGICCFQEQLMKIVNQLGGMTLVEADKFRKMMKKKDVEQMSSYREKFIAGAMERGVKSRQDTLNLWDKIVSWSLYGFNKCLTGDTVLIRSGGNQHQKREITIEKLYKALYSKTDVGQKYRSLGLPNVSSLIDGRIKTDKIKNIYCNGVAMVYELKTVEGYSIRATANHRLLTVNGMKMISEIKIGEKITLYDKKRHRIYKPKLYAARGIGTTYENKHGTGFLKGEKNIGYVDGRSSLYKRNSKIIRKKYKKCQLCGSIKRLEIHHKNKKYKLLNDWKKYHSVRNLILLCSRRHKIEEYKIGRKKRFDKGGDTFYGTVESIIKLKPQMVYDIEMSSKYHNFVANGFISHNSHACSYSQLSVWTMAMKKQYPLEFYVGWLENPKDKDQRVEIYRDILKHKIGLVYPDVNLSKVHFTIRNNEIIWALKGIKYVGEAAAAVIASNAPYTSMNDFVKKNAGCRIGKRIVDALICANAFPWYNCSYDAVVDYYKKIRNESIPEELNSKNEIYWNRMFYKYMGFYKKDPLVIYQQQLEKYGTLDTLDEFKNLSLEEACKLAGYITDMRRIQTRRGEMVILDMEVELERVPIILWSSFLGKSDVKSKTKEEMIGRFVFVLGSRNKDDRNNDQVQLGEPGQDIFEIID